MKENGTFEGWAIIELMGHNQEIGFVRTEYFGGPALFRVDQPSFEARDYVLERPQWVGDIYGPAGSTVQREAIAGKTVYVWPPAIFRITPCTEQTARQAIESLIRAPIKVLNLAEGKLVTAGDINREQDYDDVDSDPLDEVEENGD